MRRPLKVLLPRGLDALAIWPRESRAAGDVAARASSRRGAPRGSWEPGTAPKGGTGRFFIEPTGHRWGMLGACWGRAGACWGHAGTCWDHAGGMVGHAGRMLGACWAHAGARFSLGATGRGPVGQASRNANRLFGVDGAPSRQCQEQKCRRRGFFSPI